ncbi:MAG TPA: thiamine pyrophosphate-binding protein [Methylomirabilota bacterium]|nr:thiamine pyrophosphate-binding protein [Methylomirabilota bacterium]
MNAAAALMTTLRSAGVRYLFGNPGTTELPFLDAFPGSGLEYVLGLHEATAVAAADGYAQASGRAGVANVHVAPGVANALSALHNAARSRSPLVLTAGQQDTRLLIDDPILAGDLVQMTEQFTKWSYEVRRAEEAPGALRRALALATAPPPGPVFLSLPMDVMGAPVEDPDDVPAPPLRPGPDPTTVVRWADTLRRAGTPAIIAGDGVARAGAVPALVRVAEQLGARVHGEPIYRRTSFPGDHSLWRGGLAPAPAAVRKALTGADVALVVGADVFTWFLHAPGAPFPRGLTVLQLDDDARAIGRSYAVSEGLIADPRSALEALAAALGERMTDAERAAAARRISELATARQAHLARIAAAASAEADRVPISPAYLMQTLARLLPDDAIVVDESASSLPFVLRYLPFRAPGSFFGSKTGTLGWGMGAAIGVQLAEPSRRVVVTVGDGSLMYAPQALWTAAHYRLPITCVVANNASYAILKAGMLSLGLESAARGIYPGMDLVNPEVDYVALARALGVRAERVDKPGDLEDALSQGLSHAGPALVDVAIDRAVRALS